MIVNFYQKIGQFIMNNKDLVDRILKASNIINYKSRRSGSNFIITGLQISKHLEHFFDRDKIIKNREQKINDLLKINER